MNFKIPFLNKFFEGYVVYKIICNSIFLFLSFLFVSSVAAEMPEESSVSIDQELELLRNSLMKAYEGNIEELMNYLHPEIIVTWQDATVSRGHSEIREYYKDKMQGPDSVVLKVSGNPVVEDRVVFGDKIISFGKMNDTFILRGEEDQPLDFNSRFSSYVIRHEGTLKLAGMHMSVNAFNNPVTTYAIGAVKKIAIIAALIALVSGFFLGRVSSRKR